MGAGELKIDARRQRILEELNREGRVVVSELAKELNATTVTIRSDLDALERDGYLERIQGGAVQKLQNFYNLEYQMRNRINSEEKRAIAAAAAACIRDGETLFINSGSTTYFTAAALKKHKNLSVVTNSLAVAMELGAVPTFHVVLLGGEMNVQYAFTYGSEALEHLRRYKADTAILSLDGVSAESGITTHHAQETLLDKLMVERAVRTIVTADHSKLDHEGFSLICEASQIAMLVTDQESPRDVCEKLRELGVEVRFG